MFLPERRFVASELERRTKGAFVLCQHFTFRDVTLALNQYSSKLYNGGAHLPLTLMILGVNPDMHVPPGSCLLAHNGKNPMFPTGAGRDQQLCFIQEERANSAHAFRPMFRPRPMSAGS